MTRKRTPLPELLVLECFEEGLSQVQAERYQKAQQEMIEFRRKLDRLNQPNKVTSVSPAVSSQSVTQPSVIMPNPQPNQNNIIVLEPNRGTHLVMSNTGPQQPPPLLGKNTATRFPPPAITGVRTPRILAQPRSMNTAVRAKVLPATKLSVNAASTPTTSPGLTKIHLKSPVSTETLMNLRPLQAKTNPSNDVVDLTDDDNNDSESAADQKEVSIGKVSEKTFPSLVVTVRVCLRSKDIPTSVANSERVQLDARVKRVLMLTPTNFTEWLLQQGLLKCGQLCAFHRGPNGRHNSLKLGIYSDVSKFPYSGGYVWISECCPTTFVSVFSGSLFEGAPHPPTVLLKLIYHWSCQTIVQNVLQWVKVDNLYIKTMYTNLRAVCTAAIHEKFGKLGGYKKTIEVGVISLGTTTQDGQMKHIKVEVLGVLETDTKRIRLKALEPIADNDRQFMKKKFTKILEPLQQWVDKESVIVTDYTVDRATCLLMGFNYIVQNSHGIPSTPEQPTNQAIMEYLRKVIPKMFQNTLSLLSRQIIQQFLDELVWRETYGPIPSRAFDSIIQHISEQTRIESGGSLMHRLARIAANPLKNWKYERWATNCKTPLLNSSGKPKEPGAPVEDHASQLEQALLNCTTILSTPNASSANTLQNNQAQALEAAMIALEPYYYGTLAGNPKLVNEKFSHGYFKCIMCKDEFKQIMKFTDHLIAHAFNKRVRDNADTKELCKLCLKICPKTNNQNLNTHRMQVHSDRLTCRTLCKICSVKHKDAASLQSHMISSHCELDMPYHCEICKYRTSILDSIHQHFITAHGKGTRGYCPYCLKVMQFAKPDGTALESEQLRFVLHIQKHQLTVNRKCEKCLLNFTNRSILKEHQDTWHQSCKQLEDVERCTMEECTLMAAPLIDPLPSSTSGIDNSCKGTLKFDFDYSKERCCECDGNFNPEHFVGHMMCTKCRFTTCCNNSMKEHTALLHGTSLLHLRPPIIGRAPTFDYFLYCTCGYSTRNGNYMANHLVECGYKTCYTSKRKFEEILIKTEENAIPNEMVMMMTDKEGTDVKACNASQSATSLKLNGSLPPPAISTTIAVSHSSDNLLPKFITSLTATNNEVKEENMKMAVDIEETDDNMECDDLEDSMTVDDSSSEAMVLD
ncbi:zinc finger domain-containing protein relative of woc isoform X4 [Rhodnius prolixus]|uniref:zinc finger domain-containing protein relative of woc isoform X4 n=1 Tax=Rhodnius prolixus TaxID=13249 RepID=UPI003D189DBB